MSTVAPEKPDTKDLWTLLIYMGGDNNLTEECVYALTEIKDAIDDSVTKLNVLAQFDPSGVLAETKRYKLRSSPKFSLEDDARLTGWKASETDTGEGQNLLDFIRWGITNYKADHYMVVLVGHGTGTEDDFLLTDQNPTSALGIVELSHVFEQLEEENHTIDILGFDTCLMNMAEVCFELKRTGVTYLVGSEGFAPNTGWPYAPIIRELTKKIKNEPDDASPEWLARQIVKEYMNFYVPYINGGVSVDQAALEVKKITAVKERMFTLAGDLIDEVNNGQFAYGSPKRDALVLSHWETQSYNGEVYVDIVDFLQLLVNRYVAIDGKSPVIESCNKVIEAIDDLVVQNCVSGAAFQYSNGLSIYFPWAILSAKYKNLSFPKETGWLDFLKAYHDVTRRQGRGEVKGKTAAGVSPVGTIPVQLPGRATVPANKGRDGRVDSMRNPAAEEFVRLFKAEETKVESPPATAPTPSIRSNGRPETTAAVGKQKYSKAGAK